MSLIPTYSYNCQSELIQMLNSFYDNQASFCRADGIFSIFNWCNFETYEWFPRLVGYQPNGFFLTNPTFFNYPIAWHSNFQVQYPHSIHFRALRAIVENDLTQLVDLLKSKQLDPNEPIDRKYGYNPLQLAVLTNQYPLVEILLTFGANINHQDRFGNTPLMLAITRQHHETIHSLLKNGCDQTIKNKYGFTAADKANNSKNILAFLDGFKQTQRSFPRFKLQLKLETLLRPPFWQSMKKYKVYSGKVGQNFISRWQYDFTNNQTVGDLLGLK